jgi:CRP-like cAMP-binding protein
MTSLDGYDGRNHRPGCALTLGRGEHFGAIALFSHQPQQAAVEARGSLKCITMGSNQFIQHVKPILQFLQARADQYNCFINLIV